ncbi:hypothetical protein D3C76_418710 [compost metagenome]
MENAPLTNVLLLTNAVERAMQRPVELPGLVVHYGPSGYGKSCAAAVVANLHRAYHVECRDAWTRKPFLEAVLREMSIRPANTLSKMMDQAAEQLSLSSRPLIVDDVQYLLDKSAANVLTDLYNASLGTLILIGEEGVAQSMRKLERLHNRVLEWVPAEPATLDDVRTLAQRSYPHLSIADELLADLLNAVRGCLRRIAVNLHNLNNDATAQGWTHVSAEQWKGGWYTGEAPARRRP